MLGIELKDDCGDASWRSIGSRSVNKHVASGNVVRLLPRFSPIKG